MSSHPIDNHPDSTSTTVITIRIFSELHIAGTCLPVTISDKTTVSDFKLYLAKRGYPAHEQKIKLRKNGSKLLGIKMCRGNWG
jgi:hypothetical protein